MLPMTLKPAWQQVAENAGLVSGPVSRGSYGYHFGRAAMGPRCAYAARCPLQPRASFFCMEATDISRINRGILNCPAGFARALIVIAGCLSLTGCCTFEREWRNAQSYAYPANEVAGVWEGTWHSNHNGHEGKLRAIITKEGENYYHAHFKATWAHVIPYEFELPLTTCHENGCDNFNGAADLGWLAGGNYTYAGQACGCQFEASFCAPNDYGTFSMTRVTTLPQCCETSFCEF